MNLKLMKFVLLACILIFTNNAFAQKFDEVIEIEEFEDLYVSGDFYMGGQPSYDMLKWLKSEGVELIINLRTESENDRFTSSSFNEEEILTEMGFKYKLIPVAYPDGYSPENLDAFTQTLAENNGKVFIHCARGGRVSSFMMAYLIREKGYSVNDALEFGKKLGYVFSLEDILGKKIKMTIEE